MPLHQGGLVACGAGFLLHLIGRAAGGCAFSRSPLDKLPARDAKRLKKAKAVSQLSDLQEVQDALPMVVAVRGRVGTAEPLVAEQTPDEGVMLEQVVEQHYVRRNEVNDWSRDTVVVSRICREVPWYLEDNSGVSVSVIGARSADGLRLTNVSDVFTPDASKGVVKVSIDYLRGVRNLGVRTSENMLLLRQPLTVVGEASVSEDSGALRIARPRKGKGRPFYVTELPLDELLASLGALSHIFQLLAAGFTIAGVYLNLRQAWRELVTRRRVRDFRRRAAEQQHRREQCDFMTPKESSQVDSAREGQGTPGAPGADTCVICLEAPSRAVFKECGHLCCCMTCVTKLTKCPLCRTASDYIRVYRP